MLFIWQAGRTMNLFKKYVFLILEVMENGISIVWGILSFWICFILNQKNPGICFFKAINFVKRTLENYNTDVLYNMHTKNIFNMLLMSQLNEHAAEKKDIYHWQFL